MTHSHTPQVASDTLSNGDARTGKSQVRTTLAGLPLVWQVSRLAANASGPRGWIRRLRFMHRAAAARHILAPVLAAAPSSALARLIRDRPMMIEMVVSPYLCAAWTAEERFARIRDHCAIVERLGLPFDFRVEDSIELLDLGTIQNGLHVVLDQAEWFHREGQLVLNLFVANRRIFSLAFSLATGQAGTIAYVGAVQGRALEGVLDDYKELTKAACGMRPRDLLIELFRILCRVAGFTEIRAVSDASRQHRSRYFGPDTRRKLPANYDEIWLERGGERIDDDFFSLPLAVVRDEADVPARKRAMYRRRAEMLAAIEAQMRLRFAEAKPVRRPQAE